MRFQVVKLILIPKSHQGRPKMKRSGKLFLIAMAFGATAISGTVKGSPPQEPKTSTYALTVNQGKSGGDYAAGTLVIVSADAPQAGAQFAGWTGDVAILANPFLPTTTATIPYMAVTISSWSSSTSASLESGKAIPSRPTIILDFRHPDFQSKALPFD